MNVRRFCIESFAVLGTRLLCAFFLIFSGLPMGYAEDMYAPPQQPGWRQRDEAREFLLKALPACNANIKKAFFFDDNFADPPQEAGDLIIEWKDRDDHKIDHIYIRAVENLGYEKGYLIVGCGVDKCFRGQQGLQSGDHVIAACRDAALATRIVRALIDYREQFPAKRASKY